MNANGTFGPSFIDPYLNEFQDSFPGFDATFAPGTPQRQPSNRTFAPGATAWEDAQHGSNMYENLKQMQYAYSSKDRILDRYRRPHQCQPGKSGVFG